MDYHGRIMNLRSNPDAVSDTYMTGHRDARHAAAEIATEADRTIAALVDALENLLKVHECEGGTRYHAGDIARAALSLAKGETG